MRRCGSPAMKCEPSSSAYHARSRAAIVPMAVLFATGSSTRHRSGNRASGLRCDSKSFRAPPAFRSEMAPGRNRSKMALMTSSADTVEVIFRREAGRLISVLTRLLGPHNLQLAEDVVQEAFVAAMQDWSLRGVPENPPAW